MTTHLTGTKWKPEKWTDRYYELKSDGIWYIIFEDPKMKHPYLTHNQRAVRQRGPEFYSSLNPVILSTGEWNIPDGY